MTEINWSNVTDFGTLPSQANIATGGLFWPGVLHLIWIVLLLLMIGYGFEVALLVSSFLALIISFMLVYSGLAPWGFVAEFAGIILFLFLYILWSGRK